MSIKQAGRGSSSTIILGSNKDAPPARVWQAVDPARAEKITGMLLDLDVHQIKPLNVHQIVALIIFPDMVRSSSPGSCLHSPTPARLRPAVPQLQHSIKEAQGVLECAHFDGSDRSDSLEPDGAESADGFEARARAYSNRAFFRDEPFPQTILFARRRH